MSELPKGWAERKLGDVFSFNYGKSLPASDRKPGPFKVYGSNGIVGTHIEAVTQAPVIIVGRKGSIGEVHYSAAPCYPIDTTYFIDDFNGLEPRFVKYLFNLLPFTRMNRATAIPGLSREDAYNVSILLPPQPEQRRIVAKVDGLNARTAHARKELDRIPILIARYKQRLLVLAFAGELTAGWRKQHGIEFGKEIALGDVASSFNYGTAAKSAPSGEVPVLRMGNIQDGKLVWTNLVYTSDRAEINKYLLSDGDVLFNRTNSPELVGKTALFKGERSAIFAGYLIRIRCSDALLPAFLSYSLNSPAGRKYCWDVKTDGVSQSNVNAKKLAAFRFLLPSIEEQAEIVRRIGSAFDWLDRIAADHAAAARLLPKLDAAILAKAFRGELVPQDPNDEPAGELLERMKVNRNLAPMKERGSKVALATDKVASRRRAGRPKKGTAMPKSRKDNDVNGQPYLAKLVRDLGGVATPSELYAVANLELVDFYQQLSLEHDKGWVHDDNTMIKAA